jgi:triosephosphate isomerase
MRKPVAAGNWKMHKTRAEAETLAKSLVSRIGDQDKTQVVLAPPFTALDIVGQAISGTQIALGAQDVFYEKEGAYTGAVSCAMLLDLGCRYVLIGHSERRQQFGETDAVVNRKSKAALASGLLPILCVGETLQEREEGRTFKVLETQVQAAFQDIPTEQAGQAIIAYEPVWAIGTGKNATPDQIQQAHRFLRKQISNRYGFGVSVETRILYGGSVKAENIAELAAEPEVDGALVGGASLSADSFALIVNEIAKAKG